MSRDPYDRSDDISDVTSVVPSRRVEVLSDRERRRRWSDETKIAIVAEALAKGVVVSEVARRHDMTPSQLFPWIKQFRAEAEALMAPGVQPAFVPAVPDTASARAPAPANPSPAARSAPIEISVGSATLRVRGPVDTASLSAVLKAMKVFA
jgi:transposase